MRIRAAYKGRTTTKNFHLFYFQAPGINGTIYVHHEEEPPKEIVVELCGIPKRATGNREEVEETIPAIVEARTPAIKSGNPPPQEGEGRPLAKIKSLLLTYPGNQELTPLKAIRLKCLDCVTTVKMVRECLEEDCPLHPYRLGNNPKRKGIGRTGGNPILCKNRLS